MTDERLRKLQAALDRKAGEGSRAQAEEIERFLMNEPSQPVADVLWKRLVTGLLILIGLFGAALVILIAVERPTDAILPVETALISLLAGIFINNSGTNSGAS